MLQFSDLLPPSVTSSFWIVRRALVILSVGVVIGASAVGTGRTIDAATSRKTTVQRIFQTRTVETVAAVKESNELMHDIAAEPVEQPRPSVFMPQTMVQVGLPKHTRVISMEVTAYCACKKCCGPNAIGLTASGRDVSYNEGRFVAADTTVLPFGTKLVIPGYNDNRPVEVIDRGSAIKGNKLDVFYPSHEEALRWGRQTIKVTVVE